MRSDLRRLFFGARVASPWPEGYPEGRCIPEEMRHITLAFLGSCDFASLQPLIPEVPKPSFLIGQAGIADRVVFLPDSHERVVASSVKWLYSQEGLTRYQAELVMWLTERGYSLDRRPFFPHISIARQPFEKAQWLSSFSPLPFFIEGIHLYQSMGNLQYNTIWEYPLHPPFEELEHTADLAFRVWGCTVEELHFHAQIALAFHFPPLIDFFSISLGKSLDEIIIALNRSISQADAQIGSPFKAVSFHGSIVQKSPQLLNWEMIVDI